MMYLMDAIAMNPTPTDKGNRLKIYYMTQVAIQPPTFVVFVNDVELMHFSYERFLENRIRAAFGFEGTPIHMMFAKENDKILVLFVESRPIKWYTCLEINSKVSSIIGSLNKY